MAKVIVVGAGISGLCSACFAAKQGHDVTVLTYGQGALTVAGGIIDLYGYDALGNIVLNPAEAIANLPENHPYALVGKDGFLQAIKDFKELTASANYTYIGDGTYNHHVTTAIGSFKPSGLIPLSMDANVIFERPKIVVVGFDLLKDYYPKLIAKNFKKNFGEQKEVSIRTISLNWPTGREYRDVSAIDIARELETPLGRLNVIEQLKGYCGPDCSVIIPPVLGEKPELSEGILHELEQKLNTRVIEVSALPPSVTGLRLDRLLRQVATSMGIEIIEKAQVIGANIQEGQCLSVMTGGYGRVREYKADQFIIATGGVFGNGLITQMGRMYEPITGIEIEVPENQQEWSYQYLFCGKPQPFASYGVSVDRTMRAIDKSGQVLFNNIFFAGRSLAGYDFCFEKSGNGVALVSAWQAAKQLNDLVAYAA